MEENREQNNELTPEERRLANLKPFEKGKSGNPNGRPAGSLNYATKMRQAIEALAKAKDMTPEELEEMIYRTGLRKALSGDYNFYRDFMDRGHGKPVQPTDITSQGQIMQGVVVLPAKEQDDGDTLEAST